jgi:uncharacterized protein (TIGR02596 family)
MIDNMNMLRVGQSQRPLKMPHFRSAAFTLMEMIVVVSIIAILAAAAVPQFFSVMKATRLTAAGDALISRIAQAQQAALALNSQVELRIYMVEDQENSAAGNGEKKFQAMQVVNPMGRSGSGGSMAGGGNKDASIEGASDAQAISEPYRLQGGIVFASDSKYSPLLQSVLRLRNNDEESSGMENAEFAALRFFPDGSFKQVKDSEEAKEDNAEDYEVGAVTPQLRDSFITIADVNDLKGSGVPKNFVCVQIDPYTGKARVYRP